MTGLPSHESNTFLRNLIALDSLDALVRESLSERSLKLRPAMKRKTEKSFSAEASDINIDRRSDSIPNHHKDHKNKPYNHQHKID
jgi:hypothetical protein